IVQKYGQRTLLSAPLLLFGILRYLQITLVYNQSASPAEVLLRDRIIQLSLLAFFGYYALIIYLHPSS
ncbi:MAG: prenyltransferase, partial [Spirochaetia bacterium]|nr:prenyltransferase [Spirochaetia bacterium]